MKLMVSAMEPSANLHLRELAKNFQGVEYTGIFDKSLGTPLYSPDGFGVMGIIDVFFKIRYAKKVMKHLVYEAQHVDKILLIDAPAFNIPFAKAVKKAYPNIEIIYYILPKVWAWKKKRAKKVMAYTDVQLSIFPFEKAYYPNCVFVGNPIVDEITKVKEIVSSTGNVAFLAGSRKREIRSLMPIIKKVRERMDVNNAYLVVPSHFNSQTIETLYGNIESFTLIRNTQDAVYDSDYAFVCSGTATLETAYIGTPFVLIYRTNTIEYKIAKLFMKLPYVGLANLLFYFDNKKVMHKEYLQEDVSVENLLSAFSDDNREAFLKKSKTLRSYLGHDCSKKVAQIILK